MSFDTIAVVDWSGGNDTGPSPRKDAIWAAIARDGRVDDPVYLRNRQMAEAWLGDLIRAELREGRRLAIGFDFPFGYPKGFGHALIGSDDPFDVWEWFEERVEDTPSANNRFDLAGDVNRSLGDGRGPFWANALKRDIPGLPRTKQGYSNPLADRRLAERAAKGAFTCWQLAGAGAVGSQVIMGLPVLARLRRRFSGKVSVWPFEPLTRQVAFIEVWPSLIPLPSVESMPACPIKDARQVAYLAGALAALPNEDMSALLDVEAPEEGWIFGLGHEDTLAAAGQRALSPDLAPPPLKDDCFAMPAGVDWTPVDVALERLRFSLSPVVGAEQVPVERAAGRVLAEDVIAKRANPPAANSAVDGYGFAFASLPAGDAVLPLCDGRAAAGVPFEGVVPPGQALRILTGAVLPKGVDTVVLEEDTRTSDGHVAFRSGIKSGANTRSAGEDLEKGAVALTKGRLLTAADLALLTAVGAAEVPARKRLRVGVLSTGDELAHPAETNDPAWTYDANRPMLLSMLARWGFDAVDLGHAADDLTAIGERFEEGARNCDAVLTSGGASAGDEDHVSALLKQRGQLQTWRIAVKPGRPLALALWKGVPVFGLPGNPVAAFVCTAIFARPALAVLSGRDWPEPVGFMVPADFSKRKKAGRREFLRARITQDGRVEVFKSEGSGRISGLSWADGLVELPDEATQVEPGTPVRYIPFSSLGL